MTQDTLIRVQDVEKRTTRVITCHDTLLTNVEKHLSFSVRTVLINVKGKTHLRSTV